MKKIYKLRPTKKIRTLLKRLLSLTPKTITIIIIALVFCTGASALYIHNSYRTDPKSPIGTPAKTNITPVISTPQQTIQPSSSTSTTPTPSSSSSKASSYRPFLCNNVPIAHQTEYRDNDSMAAGETKLVYQGKDGYVISCTADSNGYTPPTNGMRVEPVNDTVEKGTGLDEQQQQQADAEKAARDQRYTLNLAQCFQSLKARGASDEQATSACSSTVKY